jgi:hypothetical protein
MGNFYNDLRTDTALPLLKEFGMPMLLTVVAGSFDPVASSFDGTPPVTFPGYGISEGYKSKDIDGTLVQQGDQKISWIPDPTQVTPVIGDTLTIGTEVFGVKNVDPLAPGGIPVLYVLQVRR